MKALNKIEAQEVNGGYVRYSIAIDAAILAYDVYVKHFK